MKGLYCRAGVNDTEPKFVIQETVSFCFVLLLQVDASAIRLPFAEIVISLICICNHDLDQICLAALLKPTSNQFTRGVK